MFVKENLMQSNILQKGRKRIFFCSYNCLDEFTAPEKKLKKLKRQILTYLMIFPGQINNYVLLAMIHLSSSG
jgi:hypothetical protein